MAIGMSPIVARLSFCISRADRRVKRTWEKLRAEAIATTTDRPTTVSWRLPTWAWSRCGGAGLLVAIRRRNDNMKIGTILAIVGSSRCANAAAPKRTFVVGNGVRIGANACLGINGWIPLDIDVKGGAKRGVITVLRAQFGVVGLEIVISKIAVCLDRSV